MCNSIENLQGIEDRIKQLERMPSSSSRRAIPDSKLRKLDLAWNNIRKKISSDPDRKVAYDLKEKTALITLLDSINGIYNLGEEAQLGHYDPDVECVLRINHAGRKFVMKGGTEMSGNNKLITERSLLPMILERAYKRSAEIYDNALSDAEQKNSKKCATGLFHLVRHFYRITITRQWTR